MDFSLHAMRSAARRIRRAPSLEYLRGSCGRFSSVTAFALLLALAPSLPAHAAGNSATGLSNWNTTCSTSCHVSPNTAATWTAAAPYTPNAHTLAWYADDATGARISGAVGNGSTATSGYAIVGNATYSNTAAGMMGYAGTLGTTGAPTQYAADIAAYFASLFGAPSAPTGVSAASGNGSASVSFSAPTSVLTITGYTASCTDSINTISNNGVGSPIVVSTLSNGTTYTCSVQATTNGGTSATSAGVTVTPATLPGAPTIGTATAVGSGQVQVTFSAPASNGGAAITSYTVTSNPGNITASSTGSPITVGGLTNGTAYTFTVKATNSVGTGPASSQSNSATPVTVPGAPTITSVTGGNSQVIVAFTPPANTGGATITGYTATSNPGNISVSAATSPITVTGLTNGTAYTFTVKATTSAGTGSPSAASNSVTPATVPGAPSITGVVAGNAQATVTFTAPASNGGAAITGYTVTSNPAGGVDNSAGTTSLSHVITGLSNNTAYTFSVTASNSVGTGASSASSGSVTPVPPPTASNSSQTVNFNSTANIITPVYSGTVNSAGIVITTGPTHGTATASATNNTISYTPANGYSGPDSISYTISGPGGTSAPATVGITVGLPPPPTVSDATVNTALNTAVTLDLLSSGSPPPISGFGVSGVDILAQPGHGKVITSGTRVTYTPSQDYFGTDSFSYRAYGTGGVSTSSAVVTVSITGRPDPLKDARVTGLVNIETAVVKRFGKAQIFNFQQRLESRHHAAYSSATGSLPAGSSNTPAPAGGASGDQSRGYFNSWQPGTIVAYANDPYTLLNVPDRRNDAYGENTPLTALLANVVTGALSSSSLNLGTLSDAASAAQEEAEDRLEVWAAGNLRFGTRSQDGVDTRFSTDGVSIGVDKRMDRKLTLGMGMGYARDKSSIGTDGTNSKAGGNSLAGYASYQTDSGAFIDGLLGYGKVTFDTNRYVSAVNDFARASRKGDQIFGSLSLGYEYRNDGLLWSPYGRYDFSYDHLNEGTESGAGANALTYASQTASNSQLAIGMRAQSVHQTGFGVVQPNARIEYQRGFETTGQTSIAYADLLGTQYTVASTSQNTDSFVLGLGSEFLLSDTLRFGLDYQRLRSGGRENYQSINFRLTKDLKGKNDLESLLLESYSASVKRPTGLVVAAGFAYDDNVSRASAMLDQLSDTIYSLTVNKTKSFEMSEYTKLTVNGFLDIEKYRIYTGLGHVSAGMQGEYKYRSSGEFGTPTFGIFGRYTVDEYESRLRDGSRRSAGVTLRKPLTDRINLFGALAENVRTGKSAVFNTYDVSGRANLDYALAAGKTIYLTGEYRKGDVISSGRSSLAMLNISTVLVRDDVFNSPWFYAYRMKGQTTLWTLGYNLSLGAKDSMDFSWRRVESKPDKTPGFAAPAIRYIDNYYSISYLMAF